MTIWYKGGCTADIPATSIRWWPRSMFFTFSISFTYIMSQNFILCTCAPLVKHVICLIWTKFKGRGNLVFGFDICVFFVFIYFQWYPYVFVLRSENTADTLWPNWIIASERNLISENSFMFCENYTNQAHPVLEAFKTSLSPLFILFLVLSGWIEWSTIFFKPSQSNAT